MEPKDSHPPLAGKQGLAQRPVQSAFRSGPSLTRPERRCRGRSKSRWLRAGQKNIFGGFDPSSSADISRSASVMVRSGLRGLERMVARTRACTCPSNRQRRDAQMPGVQRGKGIGISPSDATQSNTAPSNRPCPELPRSGSATAQPRFIRGMHRTRAFVAHKAWPSARKNWAGTSATASTPKMAATAA